MIFSTVQVELLEKTPKYNVLKRFLPCIPEPGQASLLYEVTDGPHSSHSLEEGKEELERKPFPFSFMPWKFTYYFCSHPINQNLITCTCLDPRKAAENVSLCTSKTSSKKKERKHSTGIINSLGNQWMAGPPLHRDKKVLPKNRYTYTYTNLNLCAA